MVCGLHFVQLAQPGLIPHASKFTVAEGNPRAFYMLLEMFFDLGSIATNLHRENVLACFSYSEPPECFCDLQRHISC